MAEWLKLTEHQQKVLRQVAERYDGCRQREVADAVGLRRGLVGPTVHRLEMLGLLEVRGRFPRWLRVADTGRAWLEEEGIELGPSSNAPAPGTADGARRS